MESKDTQRQINKQEQSKLINSNNKLKNLKSDYFIQKFFGYIFERKALKIIQYNKNLQKRMHIDINNYRDYSEKFSRIEIEIIPKQNEQGYFINIKEEDKKYYHIYFNDNKEEEIKNSPKKNNFNVSKINIIIDYQVES